MAAGLARYAEPKVRAFTKLAVFHHGSITMVTYAEFIFRPGAVYVQRYGLNLL